MTQLLQNLIKLTTNYLLRILYTAVDMEIRHIFYGVNFGY